MKGLISAEWYKLRHSRVFYILLLITTLFSIGRVEEIRQNAAPIAEGYLIMNNIYSYPACGQSGVLDISSLTFPITVCIAAFVGLFIAPEFQNSTIRNAIALGKRKSLFVLSKMLISLIAVAIIILNITIILTIGFSIIYGSGSLANFEYLKQILMILPLQILLHYVFAALFCMFAFLSRNSGITSIISAAYVIFSILLAGTPIDYNGELIIIKPAPIIYILRHNGFSDNLAFMLGAFIVSILHIVISYLIACAVFRKMDML